MTNWCITNSTPTFANSYVVTGLAARNSRTKKLDRTHNSKSCEKWTTDPGNEKSLPARTILTEGKQ